MNTQLDASEIRLRVLEAYSRHARTSEWQDVDIIAEKVKMLADFIMDARTIRTPERRMTRVPEKKSKKA